MILKSHLFDVVVLIFQILKNQQYKYQQISLKILEEVDLFLNRMLKKIKSKTMCKEHHQDHLLHIIFDKLINQNGLIKKHSLLLDYFHIFNHFNIISISHETITPISFYSNFFNSSRLR